VLSAAKRRFSIRVFMIFLMRGNFVFLVLINRCFSTIFLEHERKGVYRGRNLHLLTPPYFMKDEWVWDTCLWPISPTPGNYVMINIYHYQCALTVCRNSQTETYLVESPNPKYTQVYRVSHFNPTRTALTAFSIYWKKRRQYLVLAIISVGL